MLSFPCFSKYLESFLDVRTYSIVFPRKIVVPRVIPFPRVIASPSLLVKKKLIQSTPSSYTHSHSHTVHLVQSVKKKKSHGCHCRLRHLEGDAKVESDPDWLIYELFESIQRNQIEREQSSFVPQSAKTKKKWDCPLSNLASFRMRMFSLFDVTFSWRTASYKKNLK